MGDGGVVLEVELTPVTWVIAPIVEEQQLRAWFEMGWIDEEKLHLDRAFPRDADGKPFIPKSWLKAPMTRVVKKYDLSKKKVLSFDILDEEDYVANYITIPREPLTYRRHVGGDKPTTEYFEYIDGTYRLTFRVATTYPKEFVQTLTIAGKEVGMMSRTKWGYGRFKVTVKS